VEGDASHARLQPCALQHREFHEALLDADGFEDLPGKWQAAIVEAERNRPQLRIVGSD
jgi:hypothetical protein